MPFSFLCFDVVLTFVCRMPLSCMLAHGIAGFLKERMFDVSDGYRVHVCEM